ncbi:hypothetical protein BO71DRAFT_220331 [Aspergillus ellipticus CBS 707.79]|uniref:Uncharacterized protein n=1 Tax=Aspergillus ellipticus CBS 707.79 TaxID=1448320 RepID=A0A319E2J0_9EURO|nr:hypothetical protein BO71DRAFT_220331 [Aspergillus ellipticus CBS 707.79]
MVVVVMMMIEGEDGGGNRGSGDGRCRASRGRAVTCEPGLTRCIISTSIRRTHLGRVYENKYLPLTLQAAALPGAGGFLLLLLLLLDLVVFATFSDLLDLVCLGQISLPFLFFFFFFGFFFFIAFEFSFSVFLFLSFLIFFSFFLFFFFSFFALLMQRIDFVFSWQFISAPNCPGISGPAANPFGQASTRSGRSLQACWLCRRRFAWWRICLGYTALCR